MNTGRYRSAAEVVTAAILLIVGTINLIPVVGVFSAERLEMLYGISLESSDLILLMRHRAVLFGMLGGLIVASAFKPSLRLPACYAGFVSMMAFVALACGTDDIGAALRPAVVADVAASIGLVAVLILRKR